MDPWSNTNVDYTKILSEFGISTLSDQIKRFISDKASSKFQSQPFERDMVFAHRDFDKFINAYKKGKPISVLSGIKPSGEFHLGSKQVVEELVFFQKIFNVKTYYCIADIEAYADNDKWVDQTFDIAVSNVADVLAMGLDPKNACIYQQSREPIVQRMAYYFSRKVTNATLKAVYGDKPISLYMAALTQIGDILLPQSPEHGGPKNVLIPVGIDQDPHIRLVRDLAVKNGFISPSSTYHYFMKSLDGGQKMGKRNPDSMISLRDSDKEIKRKISKALTGGRDTVDEQKAKGGQPDKCMVFELSKFHIENKKDLLNRWERCGKGLLMCGDCKKEIFDKLIDFLHSHNEKREKYLPLAKAIVEKGSFDGTTGAGRDLIKQHL